MMSLIYLKKENNESSQIKRKGSWNYIQLIQLAISILYSSRLAYDRSPELKVINTQKYSFEKADFNKLIDPITNSIENKEKMSKKIFDLIVDWINKMLKYQQMFNTERSDVFGHWVISLVPILWTKTNKTLLTWSVIVSYATTSKSNGFSSKIPKFLSKYSEEEGKAKYNPSKIFVDYEYDSSEEDDNLRHIKDFRSRLEDVETSDSDEGPQNHSSEIKAMIKGIEAKTANESKTSALSSQSIAESSKFSLDESVQGSNDHDSSSKNSQSMMQYIRNRKDYSYSIQESHSVSLSDINFK